MISHAGRMCLGEVLATKSHAEDLFIGGAFEDKLCRKDKVSGMQRKLSCWPCTIVMESVQVEIESKCRKYRTYSGLLSFLSY